MIISAVVALAALVHVENEFEVTVPAPYEKVAPLFGAWAEKAWAGPTWDPQFLHPSPARDVAGMVFEVAHGGHKAIWVNTAFDLGAGYVQYVYVVPGVQVTVIDIHVSRAGQGTHAKVLYRRTALDAAHNADVAELGAHDRSAGAEWRSALTAAASR